MVVFPIQRVTEHLSQKKITAPIAHNNKHLKSQNDGKYHYCRIFKGKQWKLLLCNTLKLPISENSFSHSVVSNSLRPYGLQHARLPFPSPTSRIYSNSCPLSQWCHPSISSSVVSFSSHLQSFPASGSFQMSQFFTSGGQNIGVSASASVSSMNIQDLFPLGWACWISLLSRGLSRVFSNTIVQKHQFFMFSFLYSLTFTFIHDYCKNHSLD